MGGGPRTSIVRARTTLRSIGRPLNALYAANVVYFSVCECYLPGSVNQSCNLTTGQCSCRGGVQGQNCDTCILTGNPFANISECSGTSHSNNCNKSVINMTTICFFNYLCSVLDPQSAPMILYCEGLQGNRGEVQAIRLNYTDVTDWLGKRRRYRVNLFKGNKTGVGQVFSHTMYVGQSASESDILNLNQSTIDFDQWYTVTMVAESRADFNQTTVGPSSDPCHFLIPTPIRKPQGAGNMCIVVSFSLLLIII